MRPGFPPATMASASAPTGKRQLTESPRPRSRGIPVAVLAVFVVLGLMGVTGTLSAAVTSPAHAALPPRAAGPSGPTEAPLLNSDTPAPAVRGLPHSGIPFPDNSTAKPQWWDVTGESRTAFPVEEQTQGTWDAADGGVLFYGGDNYASDLNGTWMYDAGQWTEISTHGNPGPLSGGSLAYDPETGYSVFYGGVTNGGTFNNTTYYYSHGNWTAHDLAVNPPVQFEGQMAYDPALGGIVLFGGEDLSTSTVLAQTWLFSNGSWSNLDPATSPPARWYPQMAYDPALGELVLYGGFDGADNWLGDTWVFANGTWTSVSASGLGVPPLGGGNLVYDPDLGTLVLVGGINDVDQYQTGTWQFDGSVWSILAAIGGPHGHFAAIGVWDPLDHEMIIAGGGGSGSGSYTDALSVPLAPVNVSAPLVTDVGVATNFSASAVGGATPYSYSWNWGDDTINATENATHVYRSPGAFVITLTVKVPSSAVGSGSSSATWQREITVAADPVPKLSESPKGIDAGTVVKLEASATGGVAPYRFSWRFSDGTSGSGSTLNSTFATPGTYLLNLSTLDSVGGSGSALYSLTVNASPTVGIAPANAPEAGAPTVLDAVVSGGVPPFTYAWQFSGGGTAQGPTAKHMFATAGEQTASVNVTDADGVSATSSTVLDVVPGVVVAVLGPTSVTAGDTPTFTANVTQGVGPYNVTWTLPSGAVANGTSTSYTFPGSGVFEISAKVVDANGVVAVAFLNVTVHSAPSALGGSIGGVPTLLVLLGVVVVVVAAVAALLVMHRRRSAPEPPP